MSTTSTENGALGFGSFKLPQDVYNEAFEADSAARPHWQRMLAAMQRLTSTDLQERARQATELLTEDGANYNVFGEVDDSDRPWDLDLIPLMASASEWRNLEAALDQRARLIDAVVRDLYGKRRLIENGTLPPELVYAHPGYLRSCVGLHDEAASAVTLYAAELARAPDGRWWVMADRLDAPAGPAYALENRIVSSRTLPQVIQRVGVQRLAPFFVRLVNALKQKSLRAVENPRIVLLSKGAQNPTYFEDVYLARYLGIDLVQGGDLAVRDGKIYLKTLAGLSAIDVILNRGTEHGIDPLVLGGSSVHGVPGLLNAIRHGNVVVANGPGCGLLESPVFMAFLPSLCHTILGEELKAPSIATWWCGDPVACKEVVDRLPEMVVKPAFEYSGGNEVFADQLTREELADLRGRILEKPYQYVAQEHVVRSAAPAWRKGKPDAGYVAVRTFLVHDDEQYHMLPGGFVRTTEEQGPMALSITAGSASKDLWVVADGPVQQVSLLVRQDKPVPLKRSNAMFPSRAADDLFWLGKSLERANFLVRLNRAVLARLIPGSDFDHADLASLTQALADLGQIDAAYTKLAPSIALVDLSEQLPILLFDPSNRRGLASAISEMIRLGSLTRDLLSQDTWRKIHQTANWYLSAPKRGVDESGEAETALVQLGANLASVSGLVHDGMIRGPAWRFLDMGRRIESTRLTCRFLLSLSHSQGLTSRQVLKSVLDVIDSRMTYRFRYLDNLQLNAVLDLAITDVTNPNSVGFQLESLAQHGELLPRTNQLPLPSDEQRQLASAKHALTMLTPESLADSSLKSVRDALATIQRSITKLSDTLTRHYLIHSGPTRQITSGEGA